MILEYEIFCGLIYLDNYIGFAFGVLDDKKLWLCCRLNCFLEIDFFFLK